VLPGFDIGLVLPADSQTRGGSAYVWSPHRRDRRLRIISVTIGVFLTGHHRVQNACAKAAVGFAIAMQVVANKLRSGKAPLLCPAPFVLAHQIKLNLRLPGYSIVNALQPEIEPTNIGSIEVKLSVAQVALANDRLL